ncbi:hypothetical protein BBD39_05565 [Arsenophonus endosymbiont of Bemisia tabaci Asia II 3]|nr:hypothetical protein BBD39_05565 [Arsenophonus endosymbiont of Bemisia tabaci Asia II 3]
MAICNPLLPAMLSNEPKAWPLKLSSSSRAFLHEHRILSTPILSTLATMTGYKLHARRQIPLLWIAACAKLPCGRGQSLGVKVEAK